MIFTDSIEPAPVYCDVFVAFPTGAFSHSIGLEAATQLKLSVTKEDFRIFALAVLENAGEVSAAVLTILSVPKISHQLYLSAHNNLELLWISLLLNDI